MNVNSLCGLCESARVERWKRGKPAIAVMARLDPACNPFKSHFAHKNAGSWLVLGLFQQFGDWLGDKTGRKDFSTKLVAQIPSLYAHRDENPDPFFLRIDDTYSLRKGRNCGRVNLTDITNAFSTQTYGNGSPPPHTSVTHTA